MEKERSATEGIPEEEEISVDTEALKRTLAEDGIPAQVFVVGKEEQNETGI